MKVEVNPHFDFRKVTIAGAEQSIKSIKEICSYNLVACPSVIFSRRVNRSFDVSTVTISSTYLTCYDVLNDLFPHFSTVENGERGESVTETRWT